jgi:hypothetical protein
MITEDDRNEHERDLQDACPLCGAYSGDCNCVDDDEEKK